MLRWPPRGRSCVTLGGCRRVVVLVALGARYPKRRGEVCRYGPRVGEDRWDVFVSYGHEDAAWVGALAGNLHRDGFDVFLDEWELVGGDRFAGRLEDAIRDSVSGV